jgi:hypothetical protein
VNIKRKLALGLILLVFGWFWSCSQKSPTPPKSSEGVIHGKVTDASTLPINGAQINIGYDLGASVAGLPHRVKKPAPGFSLQQNYPNPYEGETTIEFALPQRAHIIVEVVNGYYPSSIPATLINNVLPAGRHKVLWNSVLSDSTLLTNGRHLYRLKAQLSDELLFDDEFYFFHNAPDADFVSRMQPLTTADANGQFAVPHTLTNIGDTVAVTLETSPEIREAKVVGDSITVFVSRAGFKTAIRRVRFQEKDAPELNVVLARQ